MQEIQETQAQFLDWKDPLEEETAFTPVFFPRESCGLRSLAGCSPWGHKELETTEHLSTHTYTYLVYIFEGRINMY